MEESNIPTSIPFTEAVEESTAPPVVPIFVPPVRKKFPFLVFLLIILLTFVAAIAVYLFVQVRELNTQITASPSPVPTPVASVDPISTWRTYENSELKLSFSYPLDWDIDNGTLTDSGDILVFNSANGSLLRVYKHEDKSKTIAEFLVKRDKAANTSWEGSPSTKILSTKTTIIAGLNSIQREEYMLAAGFIRMATYFKNENSFFQISLDRNNGSDLNPDDVKTYNQILSTLKFGDASPSSTSYTCPKGEWVDCMPTPDVGVRLECTPEYSTWATKNCPGFKGSAL